MKDAKSTKKTPDAKTVLSFEETVLELEAIIKRMSTGDQTLETSIADFERGVKIVRDCQQMLQEAEQRVALLTKSADGQLEAQPFNQQ